MRGSQIAVFAFSALMAVALVAVPGGDLSAAGASRPPSRTAKKKPNSRTKARSTSTTPAKKNSTKRKKSPLAKRLAKKKAKDVIPPKGGSRVRSSVEKNAATAPSTNRPIKKPSLRKATKKLTRAQRERAAVARVKHVLRDWTPAGVELRVRLVPQQIQVNPNNPVVGRGPVDIVVSPKRVKGASLLRRLTMAFNSRVNRRILVQVSENGHGTVLAERSNTFLSRVASTLLNKLPIRELAFDAINSKQSRSGLALMFVSLASFTANPAVAVGGVVMAGQMITAGTARRRVARRESMEATGKWIKKRGRQGGVGFPSLSEAYSFYRTHLKTNKPGTRPMPIRQFIAQVTLLDVTPSL